MTKIKEVLQDYKMLLRSIPGLVTALFCISVIAMNLMANKIIFNSKYVAADGGILLSWIPYLCMDVVTKRYGPKAANKLNIVALLINLLFVGIFSLVAALQIEVGADYAQGDAYAAFDATFSCTWFVLLSSSLAFLASGILNNVLNWFIGTMFKKNPDGKLAYVCRSYISTFVAQYVDNIIFAVMVFIVFAPIYWGYSLTILQCLGSALVGALLELLMEVIFSPIGYKMSVRWSKENVGMDYLDFVKARDSRKITKESI